MTSGITPSTPEPDKNVHDYPPMNLINRMLMIRQLANEYYSDSKSFSWLVEKLAPLLPELEKIPASSSDAYYKDRAIEALKRTLKSADDGRWEPTKVNLSATLEYLSAWNNGSNIQKGK